MQRDRRQTDQQHEGPADPRQRRAVAELLEQRRDPVGAGQHHDGGDDEIRPEHPGEQLCSAVDARRGVHGVSTSWDPRGRHGRSTSVSTHSTTAERSS